MAAVDNPATLLETIRRREAEVQRRVALERESAQAVLDEAEQQAAQLLAAAEAEGRRIGEEQCRVALADADSEAGAILARSHAEAEALQRAGSQRLPIAVDRVVEMVIGGAYEAENGAPADRRT